jgi:hypothetical protein
MSQNLSQIFSTVEKNSYSLQPLLGKPLVIVMSQKHENECFECPVYCGILEGIDDISIYLKNPQSLDCEKWHSTYPDLFLKLDPAREDPSIKLPPTLVFELIDSIYHSKFDLTLEHTCKVWSDPKYFHRGLIHR